MEKEEPKKNKSKAIEAVEDIEEEYCLDVYSAASILFSLSHAKLETVAESEAMKSKGYKQEEAAAAAAAAAGPSSSVMQRKDDRPPFAAIAGIVGECSRPTQKLLTRSDLKDDQTRLSLNKNDVKQFMIPMLREGEDVSKGIYATTYDEEGREYRMKFVLWSGKMFVLTTTGWKEFYKHHDLKEDDALTVWMFRHLQTHQLCFAISCRNGCRPSPFTSMILNKRSS